MTDPVTALAAWLLAAPAQDAPSPASPDEPGGIIWRAPSGCSDSSQMRADVEQLLGGEKADLAEVVAVGTVTAGAEVGWVLDLRVETPQGQTMRRLSGEACETLAEAAALYIALAVDPLAVLEIDAEAAAAAVESEPKPEPEPNPETNPSPPPPVEPEPPKRRAFQLGARVLGAGGFGLRNTVHGGGGLGIGLVAARMRVDLTGVYQFATVSRSRLPDGAAARVRHGYGEVRACPILGGPRVSFIGCGAFVLGGFEARGSGLENAATGRDLWVGLGVTAGVQVWVVPRFAVSLEPSTLFSLVRPRFDVDGIGDVFRVGVVGGRIALGLEVLLF